MMKPDIDIFVVTAFVSGDSKAFAIVYNAYAKVIFKRLLYLLKDENLAEEMLQNVFLKVWINREGIDVSKNLYYYLIAIANNLAVDSLRKGIRKQLLYEQMRFRAPVLSESVEDQYLHKEDWEILKAAIASLPPQRQVIFTKCKIEGKSYEEVSAELAISTSTISNQLVLAMKSIRIFAAQYTKEIKPLILLFLLGN
ncbi:RNA polymerase sigma factor [Sphingobacterium sp. Mn56C]|uniref:RNA polymerase sigma factor n=1 Tax=Sphingobacterium sp. Mn56C TaxID=3395261 RepID=UPI003BD70C3E